MAPLRVYWQPLLKQGFPLRQQCLKGRRLVLLDVVQVVATDDDGALHLGGLDDARQDATADGHVAGEGALLVDVRACCFRASV